MQLSSTQAVPETFVRPRHIAIIMDGNGRWATRRHLPRTAGHIRGLRTVRRIVEHCAKNQIEYLTLFAFSSENWRRPAQEVSLLMKLFARSLKRDVRKLNEHRIRLRIVGNLEPFGEPIQTLIHQAQSQCIENPRMTLTICANYGGRWDILQAIQSALKNNPEFAKNPLNIDESVLAPYLSMSWAPEPDLLIRTGGESRISNFLIWQLAYTELYFTETHWPDFGTQNLDEACQWYAQRERRFGRTSAQVQAI